MECVFCDIVEGKLPASRVYEDDRVMAILDLFPVRRGHALVFPKTHSEIMADVSDEDSERMFLIGKKISSALRKSELNPDGINFVLSDGSAAGQEIPHAHLHIIPRYIGDGAGYRFTNKKMMDRSILDSTAELLKGLL